jgi:flagellar FliL protein
MAKDAKATEEVTEAQAPKKSKKLLIIIIAAVLLLVLVGGGAAFLLMKKSDPPEDGEEVAEDTAKPAKKKNAKKEKEAPPIFITMEPFTVNLIPETGDQYLQVVLALEIVDAHAEADLKLRMPKIRNNITLLLSSKKASELMPKEGKEKLAEGLKDEINSVIEPSESGKKGVPADSNSPVKSVLFTSFIIQ